MKKILIFIILLITLTGCTSELKLEGKITEIKYNDTLILKKDFNKIKKMLNKEYKNNKQETNDTLTIKTKKDIYYFKLSDNYINYNGKFSENKKINKYLKELINKYKNTNFYKIKYEQNYINQNNDININLDKTDNYIIIELNDTIKDFKINEIEYKNNNYTDIDLLYEKDIIDKQNIIIRKGIDIANPDIRISFSNIYNYNISIIPIFINNKLQFETKYEMKKVD